MQEQAVKGIRDVLREAFEEISGSDEILRDIGLERRRSRKPYWFTTLGLFVGGIALGSLREVALRTVLERRRRTRARRALPILLLMGAAGAGGTVYLVSPEGRQLRRTTGDRIRRATRRLLASGNSEKREQTAPRPGSA